MNIRSSSSAKLKRILKMLRRKAARLLAVPYIIPVVISAVSIVLLLSAVPFAITHFSDDSSGKADRHGETAPFETVQLPDKVTVYKTDEGKTETVDFEDYIKGVVSCEMPSSFHKEALKAQAVAARTYSAARIIKAESAGNPEAHPSAPLCDTTHCQVYKNESELRDIKGREWMNTGREKICNAVDDTEGELLYYNGKLVQQALFHSSSGGMTENSEDVFAAAVPYLVSVESPYEDEATHRNEKTAFSISRFSDAVKKHYPSEAFGSISADNIKILSRSKGDHVKKMQVGSATLTGRQIREALGLSSSDFTIEIDGDTITFTSNGSGHGVGMSQYGADGMAKEGYDYKKILSHYYSGTEVY